ncbi:MAG: DNA repair exonuclease, partial [Rhodomicrobium sp.]|nr:DNA repair exonuclease [Rhodomicrobium sp.]
MRFIHTADWQIGKAFKQLGEKEPVLQAARLDVIETIGQLAEEQGAANVLVAGDVYDTDSPSPTTLRAPLERMRRFPKIAWHLIPGNHDPHRPQGVWQRVRATGLPANIHLHLERAPVEIAPHVTLLPSPLFRKTEAGDVTAWMDAAATPEGAARIGLAHGSVTGFGTEGDAGNPIAPDRPAKAGLAYLALGDWHRTQRISGTVWYSGTPEPDLIDSQEDGTALLVELAGPSALPNVTPHITGRYLWKSAEDMVGGDDDLAGLEKRLRALPSPSRTLLRLTLRGSLSLSGHARLDDCLAGIEAAFFSLTVQREALAVTPAEADLEAIAFDGVLSEAARRLQERARR